MGFLGLSLLSSLNLRFSERHARMIIAARRRWAAKRWRVENQSGGVRIHRVPWLIICP
jgi:hypothetical protein